MTNQDKQVLYVGDKVKWIGSTGGIFIKGGVYTVHAVQENHGDRRYCIPSAGEPRTDFFAWTGDAKSWEVVERASQEEIVWSTKYGNVIEVEWVKLTNKRLYTSTTTYNLDDGTTNISYVFHVDVEFESGYTNTGQYDLSEFYKTKEEAEAKALEENKRALDSYNNYLPEILENIRKLSAVVNPQ